MMDHGIISELNEIACEWSYEKYAKRETGYSREYWQSYKLAELIIKECVAIAHEYDAPKLSGPGMIIGSMIENHFGIEE